MRVSDTPPSLRNILRDAPPTLRDAQFVDFYYINTSLDENFDLVGALKDHGIKVPARVYRHENVLDSRGRSKFVPTEELLAIGATVAVFYAGKEKTVKDASGEKRTVVVKGKKIATGVGYCSKSEKNFSRSEGQIKAFSDAARSQWRKNPSLLAQAKAARRAEKVRAQKAIMKKASVKTVSAKKASRAK